MPSALKDAITGGAATYGGGTKGAWEARRFWEQDEAIYGGLAWTDELSNLLWYPSGGFDQPKGVLVGAYPVALVQIRTQTPSTRCALTSDL